jgi:XTP/dITP diphosphohydrolase
MDRNRGKSMKKLIVASNNDHKIKEIKEILGNLPLEVISLKEAGIDIDVVEDGKTFMENAFKKAKEIFDVVEDKENYMVMSDDSGLAVDALGGSPGVFSARFAGEHGNSKKNNEKLLAMMQGKPFEERKARFICAVVLILAENEVIQVQGEVEGYITDEEKGLVGFGYDPLFYVPEFKKTFAEMSSEEKNAISHRGRALEKLVNSMQEKHI